MLAGRVVILSRQRRRAVRAFVLPVLIPTGEIGLPSIDGYEVACKMRSEPWIGKIVLVALQGTASFDYMVKPMEFDPFRGLLIALEPTTA